MSTLKTAISDADAARLLDTRWGAVTNFTRLAGGESTQAFAVDTAAERLVLRVNREFTYEKDAMLAGRFATAEVPIPAVLAIGTSGDVHWSVSRRARGTILRDLGAREVRRVLPDLANVLGAIHAADISFTTGYGNFGPRGDGQCANWRDHVSGHDALVDWEHFSAIAPDPARRLVAEACEQVDRLVDSCPEHRVLNHGDMSLDNLFGEGDRITAVIDWSDARLGDPLWDVARADFWEPDLGIADAYLAAWGTRRPMLRNRSTERMLCYQLLIAANALGFFVHTEQPQKAAAMSGRTATLLRVAARLETRVAV